MPLRALLADENLAVQKLVELTLNKEGIDVITTDNGLSALDIAIKTPPDIILADFKLEGLDIFSFIQKAKKRERLSDIPIIVLVDSTETYDPVYLRSQGIEAFFKKPIDTQELIDGIKKLSPIPGPATNKAESSDETGAEDLSEYFSSSEDDSKLIPELLGWSSPTESPQENDTVQEEQTIVSSPSSQGFFQDKQEESPFTHSEPLTETDLTEEPTVFMTADSEEDSQDSGEDIILQGTSPVDEQAGSADDDGNKEEFLSPSLETETASFSSPFEEYPLSQTEQGGETKEESTISMTNTSDEPSLDSGEDIDLLQPAPFEGQAEAPEQRDDPFPISEASSSEDALHPPIEDDAFSGAKDKDTELEDKPLDRTSIDEASHNTIQSTTEKIVKEMLPGLVKSSLSKEMIANIVEGVVWEAVTPLAEAEIKKAIERLQSEEA